MLPARLWIYVALAILLALGIILSAGNPAATREETSSLLDTGTTTLGQKLSYPAGVAARDVGDRHHAARGDDRLAPARRADVLLHAGGRDHRRLRQERNAHLPQG